MGLEPISVHVSWCTYQVCFNSAFPLHVLSEPVESKRIPIVRSLVLRLFWYPGPDSNRHTLRWEILSLLRLPISPPGQVFFFVGLCGRI